LYPLGLGKGELSHTETAVYAAVRKVGSPMARRDLAELPLSVVSSEVEQRRNTMSRTAIIAVSVMAALAVAAFAPTTALAEHGDHEGWEHHRHHGEDHDGWGHHHHGYGRDHHHGYGGDHHDDHGHNGDHM
jgi:hypothetical protein